MNIKLKKMPALGMWDEAYGCWRQSDAQRKRQDINPRRLYLVKYDGVWLLGRFVMQWFGWSFHPNMVAMTMQIEHLEEIYEVVRGLRQKKRGSTASQRQQQKKENSRGK